MNIHPRLLPQPRSFELLPGFCHLPSSGKIGTNTPDAPHIHRFAKRLEILLCGTWRVQYCPRETEDHVDLYLFEEGSGSPESGTIALKANGKGVLRSPASRGLQYLCTTLLQLVECCGRKLPSCSIYDEPAISRRGYMLDISRDRVPTIPFLCRLVSRLADLKYNELQLYTEHTFAYRNHESVWVSASPMDASDVAELEQCCQEHHIDLVPNQNTFGHFERWLALPEYSHLAEAPSGFVYPWGTKSDRPSCLDPTNPESIRLISELLGELLPLYSSQFVNVGCDETWELGQGKSSALCSKVGTGKVYLDHLLNIHNIVRQHGKRMQFWGEVVLRHSEIISELPGDAVALNWGYDAGHPFAASCEKFSDAGIPFYVCPGTSSWLSIAGQTSNAFDNIANANVAGIRTGAQGLLLTDWGDCGHWQPPSVSILPVAFAAACAWEGVPPPRNEFFRSSDQYLFYAKSSGFSEMVFELGNLHTDLQTETRNSTVLFDVLRFGKSLPELSNQDTQKWNVAREKLWQLVAGLQTASLACRDSSLIVDELLHCANLIDFSIGQVLEEAEDRRDRLAARRLLARQMQLWLSTSRPGGLTDSITKLAAVRNCSNQQSGSLV